MSALPVATAVRRLAERGVPHRGGPNRNLVTDLAENTKLISTPWRTPWRWAFLGVLLFLYLYLPAYQVSDSGLGVLVVCGIFAIGAIGLNMLIGYAGQISLGHAFFIGVGAYTAAQFGTRWQWPLPLFLIMCTAVGFALGALVGPFALRLRGHYLVIVTIGLVFTGEHLWSNWDSVTGGIHQVSVRSEAPLAFGPFDLRDFSLGGESYSFEQSMFWFVWALVAVSALLAKNLTRSRAGRAMQAIRDRDLSAECIGIDMARYKVGIFAWSSAYAGLAGGLFAVWQRSLNHESFDLLMSITYVAMIIIGGIGTIAGGIIGALVVWGGQHLINENNDHFLFNPLVGDGVGSGLLTTSELNGIVFGGLIIVFLLAEPRGLMALWQRFKTWVLSWPFSY